VSRFGEWLRDKLWPVEVTNESRDFSNWAHAVADHREVCQCEYNGRLISGGLVGRCEPHLGTLRECRWHAHMYSRPKAGDYEQGPG